MTELRDPPEICIKAGYYMTKARLNFEDKSGYELSRAIELVLKARRHLEKNEGMFQMRASPVLVPLYEALHVQEQYRSPSPDRPVPYSILRAAAEKVGIAHHEASKIMTELGFRPITIEDFKQFGAGGGR